MYLRVGSVDHTVWVGDFNAHVQHTMHGQSHREHGDSRGKHLWEAMIAWGYRVEGREAYAEGTFRVSAEATTTVDYFWMRAAAGNKVEVSN